MEILFSVNYYLIFYYDHPTITHSTGDALLFVEEQTVVSQRWNGNLRPLAYFQERYGVQHIYYTHQLAEV